MHVFRGRMRQDQKYATLLRNPQHTPSVCSTVQRLTNVASLDRWNFLFGIAVDVAQRESELGWYTPAQALCARRRPVIQGGRGRGAHACYWVWEQVYG